jgi:hypothetical protein
MIVRRAQHSSGRDFNVASVKARKGMDARHIRRTISTAPKRGRFHLERRKQVAEAH